MIQVDFGVKPYLLLHVSVTCSALRLIKGTYITRYQGSGAWISRLNMDIDIYKIHLASNTVYIILIFNEMSLKTSRALKIS